MKSRTPKNKTRDKTNKAAGPGDETTGFGGLTRSELMSRIRSRGNKSTELRLMETLRSRRLKGWRRHADLPGRPDFVWPRQKVAVFVDGCFWHGHDCGRNLTPRSNAEKWETKISGNRKRDARVSRELRARGWSVIRIWECRLKKDPVACVKRIERALGKKEDRPAED